MTELMHVPYTQGMKQRDLPEWFQPCFEVGGLCQFPTLRGRSGKLFFVTWKKPSIREWPVATEYEVKVGDFFIANSDGGVSISFEVGK